MEAFSAKTTFGVVLAKLLIAVGIYGPITNGWVQWGLGSVVVTVYD
jgi:hypothetical protein